MSTRSSRPKLQKGQNAQGGVFYYSKKPSGVRSDYVTSKAKNEAPKVEKTLRSKRASQHD